MNGKILTVLLLAVVCGTPLAGRERFIKKNLPPRKICINEKQILTIPQKSSDLEIVVDQKALSITQFAAKELKTHLEKALNTSIPVVNTVSSDKISFIIGVNGYSHQAGLDEKKLTRDSFMIRRIGKKIYIIGTDAPIYRAIAGSGKGSPVSAETALRSGIWLQMSAKGTLFGVYDFLERFAGVRFFFPNELGVVIPKGKALKLPGIDIFDRADNDIRLVGFYKGKWEDVSPAKIKSPYGEYVTPQRNLSAWRWRMQTAYTPVMHALNLLSLEDRFGKTHPEYFALRTDGRRHKEKDMSFVPHICYASGVADEIYQDMQALAAGLPPSSRGIKHKVWIPVAFQEGYFSISLMDGLYPCHCEKCWKYLKKDAQLRSDYIWQFGAKLADRARADKLPLIVTMFAYHYTTPVPRCAIPDNMHVQVCTTGPVAVRTKKGAEIQMKLIRAWNAKVPHGDISLFNYTSKYENTRFNGVPNLIPRAFGRFYTEAGPYINGAYAESVTDDYLFNYLNVYIFGKAMWSSSCDWVALLKDHYRAMFGPAADTMEKIYEEMEDIWLNRIQGNMVNTSLGPKYIAPSEYEVWTEIYSPAKLVALGKRYDLAEQQAADDPESLARVKYIRKHFLDGMLKQSKAYLAMNKTYEPIPAPLGKLAESDRIVIDGKLDEPGWKKRASKLKLLALHREVNGDYPDTFVYTAEDKDNLYIAFECLEPDHKNLEKTPKRKRDDMEIWSDNSVEIFLSPAGKRGEYYQLMMNSAGSLSDQFCEKAGSTFIGNKNWDSKAVFAVREAPGKWILEMAVPKKAIPGIENGNIRANFCRTRPVQPIEHYVWGPFPKGFHDLDRFGILVRGMKDGNFLKYGDFSMQGKIAPINKFAMACGPWSWRIKMPEATQIGFDRTTFVTGTQSLKIKAAKSGLIFAENAILTLKPDTKYRLSFYMKTENVVPLKKSGGACMRLTMLGEVSFHPKQRIIGTRDWFRQTFEVKTPAEPKTRITYVCPSLIYASGTVWFDDIRIEEVKEEK